ncbi:MAG: protein kinase [Planctomycetes bacterium]|nr:protein kinase [Planctomycetota bacterium]
MLASERYELLEELGRGGMGVVYRARDRTLGREVAVKVLRCDGEAKPHLLARMMREAQVVAALEHPNIVRIHDVLENALVMEYVRGRPLELKELALKERLKVLEDVARAIHAAHERGIVHRDLKPGNVLREETGRVVVMDFGLAHLAEARSRLTRSGAVMGTPLYMAPEQIRGERVDGRADVYSLGVMLYEALAGRVPFTGSTVAELYVKVLARNAPPLTGVPRDLVTVCGRALAKDPRDRYQTAAALAEDLASYRTGRSIAMRPMSTWTRLARRKTAVAVAAGMGLLVAFAAGTAWKLHSTRKGTDEARRVLVEEMRRTSASCLEAALDLRRVGQVDRMGEYASKVDAICDAVIRDQPQSAEPHFLRGRMRRALMEDREALVEQESALAKEPGYVPARYERLILVVRLYGRRTIELKREHLHREGLRLAQEGAGEVRAGRVWTPENWLRLAEADPKARGLMKRIEEDMAMLKAGAEDLTEGQRECAEGLRAWVVDRCEEIRSILTGALGKDPCLEEAVEALAWHEEQHDAFEQAVRWWTEGVAKDRGYVTYFEGRGVVRSKWALRQESLGQDPTALYREAIQDFSEALKLQPGRSESWMFRGMERANWGVSRAARPQDVGALYEAAIADLSEALRLDPERAEAWMYRGTVRFNQGWNEDLRDRDPEVFYKEAIADYDEALKRDPALGEAWIGRGDARMKRGIRRKDSGEDPCAPLEAAIADFGEGLKLDPGSEEGWVCRGGARSNLAYYKSLKGEDPDGLYEQAIEDAAEALKLNPKSASAFVSRAKARLGWGEHRAKGGEDPRMLFDEGVADLHHALAIDGQNEFVWRYLGTAYRTWGRYLAWRGEPASTCFHRALEAYQEVLRLDPEREAELRPWIEECRRGEK